MPLPPYTRCDAIVVGAGPAGVAAARELLSAGLGRVVVLEARHRVGGRVHASDELGCGVPLDHGGQWIHGYSRTHPMALLARDAGITASPMVGGRHVVVHCDGQMASCKDSQMAGQAFRRLKKAVKAGLRRQPVCDCTWAEALSSRVPGSGAGDLGESVAALLGTRGDASERQRALLHLRVYSECENYEGARLDRWSARNGDKATCVRGPNADVDGGYGNLIGQMAQGLDVRLARRAVAVEYPSAEADADADVAVRCVATAAGRDVEEVYCAPCCVVALPLGVLRSGSLRFEPPLPPRKVRAAEALGVAMMNKVELLWGRRWWPSHVASIGVASRESSPTYHPWPWFLEPKAARRHPLGWGVLVCFVTGQFADEVEGLEDLEVVAKCIAWLRRAFPDAHVQEPRAAYVTRWGREPCSLGSWTYFAKGSGPQDCTALAEPAGRRGCVAFAGEHVCDGSRPGLDIGTVHGAWVSGVVAAQGLAARFAGPAKLAGCGVDVSLMDLERGDLPSAQEPSRARCWRSEYRHRVDDVIPSIDGYVPGAPVEVTARPEEIAEEFAVDPDERPRIAAAQACCGKRGSITARSP